MKMLVLNILFIGFCGLSFSVLADNEKASEAMAEKVTDSAKKAMTATESTKEATDSVDTDKPEKGEKKADSADSKSKSKEEEEPDCD